MGRAKRSRKLLSINRALRKQKALHNCHLACMSAMFAVNLAAVQAAKMKKAGSTPAEINQHVGEHVIPMINESKVNVEKLNILRNKFDNYLLRKD